MKYRIITILLLTLNAGLAQQNGNTIVSGKPDVLFILGGQSNMAGNGFTADLPKTRAYQAYRVPPKNVSIWDVKHTSWKPVKLGSKFGPEIGFANTLSKALPDKHIGIIKYAVGGTSMNQWKPGGKLYSRLLLDYGNARKTVPNAKLAAMLWHQGESDSNSEAIAQAYKLKLTHFIEVIRRDTESADLPFIYGQINPAKSFRGRPRFLHADIVRRSQAELNIPNAVMIKTDDCEKNAYVSGAAATSEKRRIAKDEDNIHYSATGQIKMGIRFAEAYSTFDRASYFDKAQKNALLVREGYDRCRRYVDAWLAYCDKEGPVKTMLIPQNADTRSKSWTPRNAAADNYAFMVLSTSFTDPEKYNGIMKTMLTNERKYASLPDGMPVTYRLDTDKQVGGADVFGASEYVKDGLMAIVEWMGSENPWFDRLIEIESVMWSKYATVKTASGDWMISENVEVNGEQLQMLPRIYWLTGEKKWLEYAIRIADHYLLGEGNHPTDDTTVLRFRDHGNEIMGGLSELYATLTYVNPAKAAEYKKSLYRIYDRALEIGRNEDGFFYNAVNPQTGKETKIRGNRLADTFGYVLNGFYTLYLIDGKKEYRDATRKVLENIYPKYMDNSFGEKMDGRTDSAEGVMNLYNREPVEAAALWVDDTMQDLWSQQKENGIVSGIYPDGNFARTTIMYCLWKSQGLTIKPYDKNVAFGAVEHDGALYISISSKQDYEGRIIFDQPRSKTIMRLPMDWPRINQFQEWFTASSDANYVVYDMTTGMKAPYTGNALRRGLPVSLKAGVAKQIRVDPTKDQE